MQNVRIFFSKTGDAKYISHLDLMRCFSRAMTRAEIPLWYTEGFNPRPYMNFAMPLSLGMEGSLEILDIRTENEIKNEEIKDRLNATLPRDIRIVEVKEPVLKAQFVAFSRYKIEIGLDKDLSQDISKVLLDPNLTISKVGKQGKQKVVKEIALTGHVKDLKIWTDDGKNTIILVTLPSNPQFGINPGVVMNRVFEILGITPNFMHITRKYLQDDNLDKFA